MFRSSLGAVVVINKFPLNSEAENLLTKTKIYGKAAEKGVGRDKRKQKRSFSRFFN